MLRVGMPEISLKIGLVYQPWQSLPMPSHEPVSPFWPRVSRPLALQGQWLVRQHCHNRRASGGYGNPVMVEQIAALGNDEVHVLHLLQPLVMVRMAEAHAGAD